MHKITICKYTRNNSLISLLKRNIIKIIATTIIFLHNVGAVRITKLFHSQVGPFGFVLLAEIQNKIDNNLDNKNFDDQNISEISFSVNGPNYLIKGISTKYKIDFIKNTSSKEISSSLYANIENEAKNKDEDKHKYYYKVILGSEVILEGLDTLEKISELSITPQITGWHKLRFQVGNIHKDLEVRIIHGLMTLLPPFLAIFLALAFKEVLLSLFIGTYVGSVIVFDYQPFASFLRTIDKYILEALSDTSHAAIIIFSVTLGGMIGVINSTGGMQGIVEIISKFVRGPRSAQLATSILGMTIFFDDYANTLIVGNSMRPITDKYKVSREKLSYIVDSTSAPIAGIALISTWIGYEIGIIRQVYVDLNIPETNFYSVFIKTIPYRFYCILTIIFVLLICLLGKDYSFMFEAEKRARLEGKPLRDGANPISTADYTLNQLPTNISKRWYNAIIPILFVIFGTLIGLFYNGYGFVKHFYAYLDIQNTENNGQQNHMSINHRDGFTNSNILQRIKVVKTLPELNLIIGENQQREIMKFIIIGSKKQNQEILETITSNQIIEVKISPNESKNISLTDKIRYAFSDANSQIVLLWISISGSLLAILLGVFQKILTIEQAMKAWIDGAKSMTLAMCVLVLAWSVNSVCKDLKTAEYLVSILKGILQPWLIPVVTFISACLISFSTGTSWGTMAILLPISIPIAYNLHAHYYDLYLSHVAELSKIEYIKQMLLLSIGAVLEGSIFGDHCSPISDTTIMSSMASSADHIDHVKTQIPYALTVATFAIVLCYLPASFGFNPYLCITISVILLALFIHLFGKSTNTSPISSPVS